MNERVNQNESDLQESEKDIAAEVYAIIEDIANDFSNSEDKGYLWGTLWHNVVLCISNSKLCSTLNLK